MWGDVGPCSVGPGAAVAMRTAGGTAVNLTGAAATSHPSPIAPGLLEGDQAVERAWQEGHQMLMV